MTPQKKSGWWKWVLGLVLVGGGIACWQWYSKQPKNEAVDYKTNVVSRGEIVQSVTSNGQINPVKTVQVGSQVSGIVTKLYVDFNSQVTNNQVVAQIDPSTYDQNLTQATAELANSMAAWEYANLNMKRAKELRASDLIPPADLEKATTDLHQAEAGVKIRESAVKRAKVDLEKTTIYSPIDGLVISRSVDEGQTVAASFSAPVLFQIANDLRKMQIEAMVSEADVGGVEVGQKVTFLVDAFPSRPFRGDVKQVRYAPITNQNVVNYICVVDVNNYDLKLRPGMTANATIVTAQRTDAIRVPNAAFRFRPTETAGGKGATNKPPGAAGKPVASGPPAGGGGDAQPSSEERRKRWENATPEQREQMRAMRGRGDGGGQRGSPDAPVTRTVYLIEKGSNSAKPALKPATIKTGISDGNYTEVIEGLKEGDVVVTGINVPMTASTANRPPGASTPFGSPMGGGMRPR